MTIQGTIVNGTVVLDQMVQVPDGTRVEVTVQPQEPGFGQGEPTLAFLLKYAGCISDMPADFAEQHDHYIHGTPKK